MASSRLVGAPIKRREDPRFLTGEATYVDDLKLHDLQYMAVLRSVQAHARIRRIDTSKALALPGVLAVFTGEDIRRVCKPLPCGSSIEGLKIPEHNPLAVGRVCHLGEAVAAVIASDRYLARDALDLMEVEYEPLAVVVDAEKALEGGSPRVHEQFDTNVAYRWELSAGDIEGAFREADLVVKQRMVQQRLLPMAMETRGVVAQYDPGRGALTLWSSTQVPHILRSQLADMLGLPENRVRVIAPDVGGAFGSKLNVYAEDAIAAAVAMLIDKPVKWIEERTENFLATTHGRAQVAYAEAAAKRDGTLSGLRLRIIADLGAYQQLGTPDQAQLTGLMATGCYKIPSLQVEVVGVFTNKTPEDAYRGAGRPEAAYYIERIMDLVAAELGLDPAEVRRRNFIQPNDFPYTTPSDLTYDTGNYEAALARALEMADYRAFREQQARLRQEGRYLGIGLSSYVEICGFGMGFWESATVRVDASGRITVLTGVSPHGQGQETSFAQLAADELGVPIDDIRVIHGDTDLVASGIGTFGSRGIAVGGSAVLLSLAKVKEKALKIAAHQLEARLDDMVFEGGRLHVKGQPERGTTFQEVAAAAFRPDSLPPDLEPGLEATSFFHPSNTTYPFGTHVAVVEVDLETGEPRVLRYIAVDDCGKVINPLLVEGQICGGIAQGIAQALYEEAVYDESGQLLSGSLMDYAIPTASMLPRYELDRTETPTPINPMGAKGVGEAATIGSTPAVVNAVVDALSPFGIRHIDMPLKAERIWRLLQQVRAR